MVKKRLEIKVAERWIGNIFGTQAKRKGVGSLREVRRTMTMVVVGEQRVEFQDLALFGFALVS